LVGPKGEENRLPRKKKTQRINQKKEKGGKIASSGAAKILYGEKSTSKIRGEIEGKNLRGKKGGRPPSLGDDYRRKGRSESVKGATRKDYTKWNL